MKTADLNAKSKGELKEILQEKRQRADELIFLLRQKKVKNVKELSWVRKDIARILTLLNKKA